MKNIFKKSLLALGLVSALATSAPALADGVHVGIGLGVPVISEPYHSYQYHYTCYDAWNNPYYCEYPRYHNWYRDYPSWYSHRYFHEGRHWDRWYDRDHDGHRDFRGH